MHSESVRPNGKNNKCHTMVTTNEIVEILYLYLGYEISTVYIKSLQNPYDIFDIFEIYEVSMSCYNINSIYSIYQNFQDLLMYNVPPSTLTSRAKGVLPQRQSHQHELKLTEAHESVLEQWCKVMGHRGVPITYQLEMLRDHASDISGQDVGATWPKHFMMRHPGLKIKYTTGLEQSCARSLNPNAVRNYFDLLMEIMAKYNITPENIYNMDEKGIQLGIGKRVAALVDRGQKTAYQVEAGSRELVTIIETISADASGNFGDSYQAL